MRTNAWDQNHPTSAATLANRARVLGDYLATWSPELTHSLECIRSTLVQVVVKLRYGRRRRRRHHELRRGLRRVIDALDAELARRSQASTSTK